MEKETFFSINGRLQRKDHFIRVILLSIPVAIMDVASESLQEP